MPATFHQLLEASISYLEDLKQQGNRYVPVRPETLEGLADLRYPSETPVAADPEGAAAPAYEFEPVEQAQPQAKVPEPEPERLVEVEAGGASVVEVVESREEVVGVGGQSKAEAIEGLRERALVCMKCPSLASSRKSVVFGVGNVDAELMFVGEAPGADEDAAGEPFVGKAGQLLTKIIETMGLSREQVYIANILKCRPDTPGKRSGNRKPTIEEMKTCSPYLHAQIDLIRPKVLVALGATAVEGLLGSVGGITRLRGNWKSFRDTPLMPTYHPAYLLRNQAMQEKRKVWEDMLQVMERLALPLTEKHRGYFLPR